MCRGCVCGCVVCVCVWQCVCVVWCKEKTHRDSYYIYYTERRPQRLRLNTPHTHTHTHTPHHTHHTPHHTHTTLGSHRKSTQCISVVTSDLPSSLNTPHTHTTHTLNDSPYGLVKSQRLWAFKTLTLLKHCALGFRAEICSRSDPSQDRKSELCPIRRGSK